MVEMVGIEKGHHIPFLLVILIGLSSGFAGCMSESGGSGAQGEDEEGPLGASEEQFEQQTVKVTGTFYGGSLGEVGPHPYQGTGPQNIQIPPAFVNATFILEWDHTGTGDLTIGFYKEGQNSVIGEAYPRFIADSSPFTVVLEDDESMQNTDRVTVYPGGEELSAYVEVNWELEMEFTVQT